MRSLSALLLAATPVLADEIVLRGGGRISGRIVERTETRVGIETGPGRVTLPMSRVERIVEGRSVLDAFAERAGSLDANDVNGWAALARWAEERELLTQARLAWQRVLAIDPRHAEANAGLGRVSVDGVWMSSDDAYRARGYVSYEGRWLTPAEHEAAVRERAADQATALELREANLRVREAEARVREAEARAEEAAYSDQSNTGIPLWGYGYGYGYGGYPGGYPVRPSHHVGPGRPHPRWGTPGVQPTPQPRPTTPTRPSSTPSTRPTPRAAPRHAAVPAPEAPTAPPRRR